MHGHLLVADKLILAVPAVYLIGMWGKRRSDKRELESKETIGKVQKEQRKSINQQREATGRLGREIPQYPLATGDKINESEEDLELEDTWAEACEESARRKPIEGNLRRSTRIKVDAPKAQGTARHLSKAEQKKCVVETGLSTKPKPQGKILSCSTQKILGSSKDCDDRARHNRELYRRQRALEESSKRPKTKRKRRVLKKFMAQTLLKKHMKKNRLRDKVKQRLLKIRRVREWSRAR